MRRNGVLCTSAAIVMLTGCGGEDVSGPPYSRPEPYVYIESPPPQSGVASYSTVITFRWSPAGENPPGYTRHLVSQIFDTSGSYNPGFDFVGDLNGNPGRYEELWSEWAEISGIPPAGLSAVIGDDEYLQPGRYHFFAVQAKDRHGNVTETFDKSINVRHFLPRVQTGPYLTVYEPLLGGLRAIGTVLNPVSTKIPPGITLRFSWLGSVSAYHGDIRGYRYGWDIQDPALWDAPYDPERRSSSSVTFYSGTHTLLLEVSDLAGNITRASYTIEIVQWPMDRDLLWVDDLYSTDVPVPDCSWPTESDHDDFWLGICGRCPGFDPSRDVHDCSESASPPPVEDIGRYRNIIWTYSYANNYWNDIVDFTPESRIGDAERDPANVISMFLRKGGHLWSLGRSDRTGGLAAVLPPDVRLFPLSLECESAGLSETCGPDRSGVNSAAYLDYCVTVLDKVSATFRDDPGMSWRKLDHYDVLRSAYRDDSDPLTFSQPGLPQRLTLRDEVTAEGSYFSFDTLSTPGGFTYVEVYDPEYWMRRKALISQPCFHPIYRMSAADSSSAVNGAAVAIWLTRYEHVVPESGAGAAVAAPSVHFGLPLWFFREESVDSIADVVFEKWGIR